MKVKKKKELEEALRDLEQNISLIEGPTSLRQQNVQIKIPSAPQTNKQTAQSDQMDTM